MQEKTNPCADAFPNMPYLPNCLHFTHTQSTFWGLARVAESRPTSLLP